MFDPNKYTYVYEVIGVTANMKKAMVPLQKHNIVVTSVLLPSNKSNNKNDNNNKNNKKNNNCRVHRPVEHARGEKPKRTIWLDPERVSDHAPHVHIPTGVCCGQVPVS